MKSLEGIYLEDEIIRVKKERKETFILNRCFINFGDLQYQVIKLHNKYVQKTSWLRIYDTNYCGNAVHHALSNVSLCVTQTKEQTQPVPAGKEPKSRISRIDLKCLMCNQVLHIKTLEFYA